MVVEGVVEVVVMVVVVVVVVVVVEAVFSWCSSGSGCLIVSFKFWEVMKGS
jgi:hypothetical protein